MNFDQTPFETGQAILHWLAVFSSAVLIALIVGTLVNFVVGGSQGLRTVFGHLAAGFTDIVRMSPRRVWALAMLTYRESVRRKALLVFVLFALLFMFGGWFLADTNARPDLQVKVYVSFVLTAISWLILPVVLMLSCWGLPEDIKARSLHTVVTKPARRSEVVLGRMIGFSLIGTLVLGLMGVIGYVWIQRQVPASARAEMKSRVPVYGSLSFTNREGEPTDKGYNVGYVTEFRGYIEGATRSKAVWVFDVSRVSPADLGDDLLLEWRFQSFRTHKGEIGKGLLGQIQIVNPETGVRVRLTPFEVKEYHISDENTRLVNRSLTWHDPEDQSVHTVDLYNDMVHDGRLQMEVECLNAGQYLGMARPDLFIRLPDRSFASGYFKAMFGNWLMMILIIILGVTASCFVKGPIATLLVFSLIIVGQGFRKIMEELVTGNALGGGPAEAFYRMLMQLNELTPLPDTLAVKVLKWIDMPVSNLLWLVQYIVPDFSAFRMAPYVANGFDVPWDAALLPSIAVTLGFALPCILLGYYSLRLRELEAK